MYLEWIDWYSYVPYVQSFTLASVRASAYHAAFLRSIQYATVVKNLIIKNLRLRFCEFYEFTVKHLCELVEEIRRRTWEIARDRRIRICYLALQPGEIINCPDTPRGHMRLPTKLPFLSKMDLTTDVFSRFLDIFRQNKSRPLFKHANIYIPSFFHFFSLRCG